MKGRLSRRRTSLQETEPAAREPDCRWRHAAAAEGEAKTGPRNPPPKLARRPFSRRPAAVQILLRSSRSPGFESVIVAKLFCFWIERITPILMNERPHVRCG